MKIQFAINPVALFGRGINCPSRTFTLDLNPADLPEHQRQLIARHLLFDHDDDICRVVRDPEHARLEYDVVPLGGRPAAELVEVEGTTVDALCQGLTELEAQSLANVTLRPSNGTFRRPTI
jgi:hypothetical protein